MSQKYEPSEWNTPKPISIEDIYNYVMTTPGNTNPNVLISLLQSLENGSSIGKSVANALLVPIVNANGTLTSPITYDQLEEASLRNIPILFSTGKLIGFANKDPSGDSFSAATLKSTITFNSNNTIFETTADSHPAA